MGFPARVLSVAVLGVALAGCGANFGSIFRSYEADGKTTNVLVDAKQRAILSAPADKVEPIDKSRKRDVFHCAEPSPDALSAITSNFAGSFGGIFGPGKEVQGALAQAFSETASELGRRNATIQLLRDGLYRQCEAYMNGLIDQRYYEQIANKYVNAMLVLLATEEITPSAAKAVQIAAQPGSVVSADTRVVVPPQQAETAPEQPEQPAEPTAEGEEGAPAGGGTATGTAKAPPPTVSVNLPDKGEKVEQHVSVAVNTMVTWFLTKDTVDYCLRGLFAGKTPEGDSLDAAFVEVCKEVIRQQMAQQGDVAAAFAARTSAGTFGEDDCTEAIRSFWKPGGVFNSDRLRAIEAAMSEVGVEASLPLLLSAQELATQRMQVGAKLGLDACR